jgi:ubiquinone biosynthesis protein Coq4
MKRPEPVRLLRPVRGNTKTLLPLTMISSHEDISGKYMTQMQNIELVKRLLSVKPSKEVRKKDQLLFYK